MLTLKRNGVDITSSIDWPTLVWTQVLTKEVDRLEFEIKSTPSKTIPAMNDTIELLEDTSKLFGGLVVEKNEKIRGGKLVGFKIGCKDWSHKLDGKLVTKKYENQTARAILLDIVATYTTGFTTANVATLTPTIKSVKFNYEQVTRAITELAEMIGWDWYVDADKDIHFFQEETRTAPFELNDTGGKFEWATLEILGSVVNLKNYIFVRGGEYKKTITEAAAIDKYLGDGTRTVFGLAYKYDNLVVKKDGVAQTIGTDQITDPATVQVLYNFNERFIRFTTAPANAAAVTIYGDAYIPIIASARDQVSITTYGEFQDVRVDKSITSVQQAQDVAKAELNKFAESTHEARFKTIEKGLRTGQTITLNSAIRGWNKQFKITRITGKARGNDHLEHEIFMLASGNITFTDVMLELLDKDKQNITIATNEVIQRLESFFETLQFAEVVSTFKKSRPYTWGQGGTNDALAPRGWNFATWA